MSRPRRNVPHMTDYAAAWDKLSEPIKERLRADPCGPLSGDDVAELVRAGIGVTSVAWELSGTFRDYVAGLDGE